MQSDDIANRLRNKHADDLLAWEAADEIERLRGGGCARDQRTTQFCAEAVALQGEVERLRGDRETMLSLLGTIADIRDAAGVGDRVMLGELAERIKHLREERDEARRMYCEAVILHGTAHRFDANGVPEEITEAEELARSLKWDCFKDAP